MDLSKYKVTDISRLRCLGCKAELTKLTLSTNKVNEVLVCSNPKCKRVGLLTVAYLKLEAKKDETKKTGNKRVPKKPV